MLSYVQFILEKRGEDKFMELYNAAPRSLKRLIDGLSEVKQNHYWHPEGDVLTHTIIVTNRLDRCYGDINLTMAGLFHDIGKLYTTKWNDKKQSWSAHNHDEESVRIVKQYKGWIKKMGADPDVVERIIANHMRIKDIDEFRLSEKQRMLQDPLLEYYLKFETADYGGKNTECKEIRDIANIRREVEDHEEEIERKRILSSKFNGHMVMTAYPELKGERLGKMITSFKNSFDDFESYALSTPSDVIMSDFSSYYEEHASKL